jgi:hypothetical protein
MRIWLCLPVCSQPLGIGLHSPPFSDLFTFISGHFGQELFVGAIVQTFCGLLRRHIVYCEMKGLKKTRAFLGKFYKKIKIGK